MKQRGHYGSMAEREGVPFRERSALQGRGVSRTFALSLVGAMVGCGGPGQDALTRGPGVGDSVASPGEGASNDDAGNRAMPVEPGATTTPRLTAAQYQAATRRLFGSTIQLPVLPTDSNPDLFAVIGAARESLSEPGVELWWNAAQDIAGQVAASASVRDAIFPCASSGAEDPCIASFLDQTGRRLFRRPLTEQERGRYTALWHKTSGGDRWQGLRYTLTAMLASPDFLYRHEYTTGTPDATGFEPLESYSLASRLAFLALNDGPDDELLDAAARGELNGTVTLAPQVDRLLALATTHGLPQFFSEYLGLNNSGHLDFPNSSGVQDVALGVAMHDEALAFVSDAIQPGADFRQLFTTQKTHLVPPLAALYGVTAPLGPEGAPYTFAEGDHRSGFLTSGAFLTFEGQEDRTKPTVRGLFVQDRFRCQPLGDQPDDVPAIDLSGDAAATSVRQVLEVHRRDLACASCHDVMDPTGLSLEYFDQFSRYRTAYPDGASVEAKADFVGSTATGDLLTVPIDGAKALGQALSQDSEVPKCVTKQIYRYVTARSPTTAEVVYLDSLGLQSASQGFQFQNLIRTMLMSDALRHATKAAP